MSGSCSGEYRNVVKVTLNQVQALIPQVKTCADSVSMINELAGKRDVLNNEFGSQQATLGPKKLKSLKCLINRLNRQIDALCKPQPETKQKIFAFVADLEQALMACPLEKPFLDIRSELRQLGLMNMSMTWPPVSFNNSYRDLLIVHQRLRELSLLLNRDIHNRQSPVFPIPPAATWADVNIRFLSDFRVQIWGHGWSQPLNYAEAGFEDARKKVPNFAWKLLCEFARHSGELQRPSMAAGGNRSIVSFEKSVQAIRKTFKQLFGILEDPFLSYRELRCYRTKFKVSFPNSDQN